MSAAQEEIKQKRREKILSRINSQSDAGSAENGEQQATSASVSTPTPMRTSVFERYRLLKIKEKNQRTLSLISKIGGIFIVLLSFVLSPEVVFAIALAGLTISSLYITRQTASGESDTNELEWIIKLVPLVGKLKNIERVIFVGQIGLNVLMSYLLTAVLVNILWISASRLNSGQL